MNQNPHALRATDPATGEPIGEAFPISNWVEVDAALDRAEAAFVAGGEEPDVAGFLERYAKLIEDEAATLAEMAALETGLPMASRLLDVEIPRTVTQLQLSAAAARDGGWALPTVDGAVRSMHVAVGPVVVFGPSNFPFAYNAVAGTDFAAAVAAGNPVVAKGHPLHPNTTAALSKLAARAVAASGLPTGWVQLIHHVDHDVGPRLVSDRRVGAVGFTGGRRGGLALKAAADAAGVPIYLELGSVNPVVLMPHALTTRGGDIAEQYVASCLSGVGQFCTNPGLVFAVGEAADRFVIDVATAFESTEAGVMLSSGTAQAWLEGVAALQAAGAAVVTGGRRLGNARVENTLLRTVAANFISDPLALQTEAFGPSGLVVACEDERQLLDCLDHIGGNLVGSIYAEDGDKYAAVERVLRRRVGRLTNDKMPTGVAVSPAMVHGGPFPSTGHAGFTAVGPPATLRRFSRLRCYDGVRPARLPRALR